MVTKGYFHVPIFNCYVNIIISEDLKRVINIYLKKKEDKIEYEPWAFSWNPSDECANYYLFLGKKTFDIDCLNHEKSHIVDFILEDRNIKPNDEVRAYLDGYISKKIFDFLKNKKIKIK